MARVKPWISRMTFMMINALFVPGALRSVPLSVLGAGQPSFASRAACWAGEAARGAAATGMRVPAQNSSGAAGIAFKSLSLAVVEEERKQTLQFFDWL